MSAAPYLAYGSPRPHIGATPYMYPPNNSSSQYPFADSSTTIPGKHEFTPGPISRTPSPTPSEAEVLARASVIDWKTLSSWRFWLRREWIWYYVIAIILSVITALVTIYHHQIVAQLTPAAHWVKSLPGGWAIPIVILFIISFPPLFGHEIIAILCGVVWGLWIGFAIVAAGTFLGELGNFYAFKYCCRARGEKLERTNLQYGCLARVVRDGGFRIALIARFSAIPGHFTTAVFATCGMSVWIFSLAAFLSLPKQFATVYIGVIIEGSGKQTTSQHVASYSLIAVTTIITVLAMWYIYRELNRVKPAVIYERRKARQAKMERSRALYNNDASSVSAFNPNPSDSDIPLRPYSSDPDPGFEGSTHQQWDESGHAIGFAPDPRLHAPRPRPPSFSPTTLYAPPDAAAAVTTSIRSDHEDEWSNAETPKTARPSETIPPLAVPTDAPVPRLEHTAPGGLLHTGPSPISSHPSPQELPYSGRTLSSPSSATSHDMYRPEHFASSPISGNMGAGSGLAQPHFDQYSSPHTFSPPPSYQ